MIWNKGGFTAVGSLKYRYASVFEYMFIFSKGKLKTFNPIKDRKNKHFGDIRKTHLIRQKNGKQKRSKGYSIKEFGQRFNVWDMPPSKIRNQKHPAVFPEQLAKDHIISWSNENDIVYDPFMGSGTTAKMALKYNRDFIGSEISKDYCDISNQRIKEIQSKLF
jgi:DNA modification methylase